MNLEIGNTKDPLIDELFSVGGHFGMRRSRRHPTAVRFIFGNKGGVDIFDLEKTKNELSRAEEFIKNLGASGKMILLAGGKREAIEAVRFAATKIAMPYVAGRWIGGTLTNFSQIRGRVDKMLDIISKREKGELAKYTKKERLLMDREVEKLEELFGGLISLQTLPSALVLVDSGREFTAVEEARSKGIPIVALASSDCDMSKVDYPVPANDSSRSSISLFLERISSAYEKGKKNYDTDRTNQKIA